MERLISANDCIGPMSESNIDPSATRRGAIAFQGRYFGISLGLHTLAIMLIMILVSGRASHKEMIVIDFELEEPVQGPCRVGSIPSALPEPESTHLRPEMKSVPEPVMQSVEVARTARPEPVTQASAVQSANLASVTEATTRSGSAIGRNVMPVGIQQPAALNAAAVSATEREVSVEQKRKKYLKEHFEYIRELVTKKLTYPAVARKMEWSGKVVLAFVVKEDGEVDSLRLKESSGHKVLDNSAIETVRSAAPFPKPPVAAEITIPVLFRLQ